MPDGGRLTITTLDRELTAGDVAEEDVPPGKYVEVRIEDEGSGMSEDVLARAFEPFFTTKPIGEGTGLGLSQVYGFVKQSGGIIKIDSRIGIGTVVRMLLPGHEKTGTAVAASNANKPGPETNDFKGRTVLLVEDRDDVRAQIVEALRDHGCSVVASSDGAEALASLRNDPVDMLVSDIGLPGMDGRELARRARVMFPRLPVLLITGYAGKPNEALTVDAGFEILRKPFLLEDFVEKVRELILTANG